MILLGSTGSIGVNTLSIALKYNIMVDVLVAGDNIDLLNKQIALANPNIIVIKSKTNANRVIKQNHQKLFFGESGILEALESSPSTLVVNALVGFSGLLPSVRTLKLGKTLALANKETLVVAGSFIDCSRIIPIDSEHFALSELLLSKPKDSIKRLIITASGGAIRDYPLHSIPDAKLESILKHPNWSMGQKITIDSSTMVNKLFEVLEAKWLFGIERVDAYIERNSIIHALVEMSNNAVFAHYGVADMKLPISYALLGREAVNIAMIDEISLLQYSFKFEEIETKRYPLWELKEELLRKPNLGILLNAANEIAVMEFLKGNISFGDISVNILRLINQQNRFIDDVKSIDDVVSIDKEVRESMLKS